MTSRPLAFVCALPVLLGACRSETAPEIQLLVDDGGPRKLTLSATSAFAEYIEHAGERHELRIVLSDYPVSCDAFALPGAHQTLLSLVIVTPPGAPPKAASYPWPEGIKPSVEGPIETAYSVPKVHHGGQSFLFQPGGSVELSAVKLEHHGYVKGLLKYEYSGDSKHSATAIRGSFEARFCRFLAPPPQ